MRSAGYRSQFVERQAAAARRVFLGILLLAAVALLLAPAFAAPQVAPPVALKTPVSLNAAFRTLALAQGPMDTAAWPLPPQADATGTAAPTTGVHATGWNHSGLLTPKVIKAAVQERAARPIFWDNAPARESGYTVGGLPLGMPMPADAFPGVGGLDSSHFPLSLLVSIYDSEGWVIATATGAKHARDVAGILLRKCGEAHAGMLRKPDGQLVGWVFDERSAHYFLRTLVDLGQRGLLAPEDRATLRAYIDTKLLPWWEAPMKPGGDKSAEGGDPLQWFNGGAWLGPALYDYVRSLPPSQVRARHYAVLQRICTQAAMLQAAIPGRALQTERVASWANLTPGGITTSSNYGPWSTRMWRVAHAVTGQHVMLAAALEEEARWAGKPEAAAWMVDAEGNLLP